MLILLHPEVAKRSCEECKQWLYDDKRESMADEPTMRAGKKVPRLPMYGPRCDLCPKIPKGSRPRPESSCELSEKNVMAYRHNCECVEMGTFGNDASDPIVRRNAVAISKAREQAKENTHFQSSMLALHSVFKRKGS